MKLNISNLCKHILQLGWDVTQIRTGSVCTSWKVVGSGLTAATTGTDNTTTNNPDDDPDTETLDEIDNDQMTRFGLQRRSSTAGLGGNLSNVAGDVGRYLFNAQNPTTNQSSDNNLLYTLQSLATTCLYSTPRGFAISRDYIGQQSQLSSASSSLSPSTSSSISGNSNATTTTLNYTNRTKTNSNNYQNKTDCDYGKKIIAIFPKQGPHCDQFLNKLGMMGKDKQFEFEEHTCDMANLNEIVSFDHFCSILLLRY